MNENDIIEKIKSCNWGERQQYVRMLLQAGRTPKQIHERTGINLYELEYFASLIQK